MLLLPPGCLWKVHQMGGVTAYEIYPIGLVLCNLRKIVAIMFSVISSYLLTTGQHTLIPQSCAAWFCGGFRKEMGLVQSPKGWDVVLTQTRGPQGNPGSQICFCEYRHQSWTGTQAVLPVICLYPGQVWVFAPGGFGPVSYLAFGALQTMNALGIPPTPQPPSLYPGPSLRPHCCPAPAASQVHKPSCATSTPSVG